MGTNLEETILSKALLGEFLTKSLRQAAAFPYVPNSGPWHAVPAGSCGMVEHDVKIPCP